MGNHRGASSATGIPHHHVNAMLLPDKFCSHISLVLLCSHQNLTENLEHPEVAGLHTSHNPRAAFQCRIQSLHISRDQIKQKVNYKYTGQSMILSRQCLLLTWELMVGFKTCTCHPTALVRRPCAGVCSTMFIKTLPISTETGRTEGSREAAVPVFLIGTQRESRKSILHKAMRNNCFKSGKQAWTSWLPVSFPLCL